MSASSTSQPPVNRPELGDLEGQGVVQGDLDLALDHQPVAGADLARQPDALADDQPLAAVAVRLDLLLRRRADGFRATDAGLRGRAGAARTGRQVDLAPRRLGLRGGLCRAVASGPAKRSFTTRRKLAIGVFLAEHGYATPSLQVSCSDLLTRNPKYSPNRRPKSASGTINDRTARSQTFPSPRLARRRHGRIGDTAPRPRRDAVLAAQPFEADEP